MEFTLLRYEQTCVLEDATLIDRMILEIGMKPNKVRRLHMASVLANMLRSQIEGVAVAHATRCEYTWDERYNPYGLRRRGVTATLRAMVKNGLVKQFTGFNCEGLHRPTSFAPAGMLAEILAADGDWSKLRHHAGQEVLIQKVQRREAGYVDTDSTNRIRTWLHAFNEFLARHEVAHPSNMQIKLSLLLLKRHFVDIGQKLGGRFYGLWQNMPLKERSKLTIDGEAVVELDYKSLNPAMLWGKQGINMFAHLKDAYALETDICADKDLQRDVVKKLFMAMLGTDRRRDAVNSARDEFWQLALPYHVLDKAAKELWRKHLPIAHLFFKGKTKILELQYMDSMICQSVLTMMMDSGVLVLPVHDSFVVQAQHEELLLAVMQQAFRNHCGGFDPVIERKGAKGSEQGGGTEGEMKVA